MAEASLTYKTFKLGFQGGKLRCNLGTDVSSSVDATTATTLATIIGQTATVDNVKTCLAAVCVAGKIIHQAWSWIRPLSVKATGELEVAINPDQNENLQQLLDSGEISRTVKEGFDDLGKKLKELLDKEVFDQVGKQVINLIGGFRVDSVQMKSSDLPENVNAKEVILGNVNRDSSNKHDFFAVSKEAKGITTKQFVGPGATLTEKIQGGGDMMFAGYEGDDLQKAVDAYQNVAGEYIPVKILIEGTDKTFERKFKPTTTMDEVIVALKNEEKKFYSIFRDGKELEGKLTLAQAAQDGSTVNWKAK